MEFVKVPLNIAQRAARVYHPLIPYERKFVAEQRNIKEVDVVEPVRVGNDLTDFVLDQYDRTVNKLNAMSEEELLAFAKEKKLKK